MGADNIRVICGPTAAGKSEIAQGLALEYGATIISADSRQIYRGFDIGTAKPSPLDRRSVWHESVDIADPTERYSAALWSAGAMRWITEARARGSVPLVVGGTGFYISALFHPLFEAPSLEPVARSRLEAFLAGMPTVELRRWCTRLDPAKSQLGRVQLARAVETALLSGQRLSQLQSGQARIGLFTPHYLIVDPGVSLSSRIETRVDLMIEAGWLSEVKALAATVDSGAPAWKASGYSTMRRVATGEVDLSIARERIIIETRQFAKRQRTWLRHQLGAAHITIVNPDDSDRTATIERWWKESA